MKPLTNNEKNIIVKAFLDFNMNVEAYEYIVKEGFN